jgi:hypothetical protein
MDETDNRRREGRLSYLWPIWFSQDFSQQMSQGLMVDISRGGIAFTFNADGNLLREGQPLRISFSIPRLDDDPTSTVTITQAGHVCRVENVAGGQGHAAVQFDEPLALDAADQAALELMCGDHSNRGKRATL